MERPLACPESEDSYLATFASSGGPTNPLEKFEFVFRTIFSDPRSEISTTQQPSECGLYIQLIKLTSTNVTCADAESKRLLLMAAIREMSKKTGSSNEKVSIALNHTENFASNTENYRYVGPKPLKTAVCDEALAKYLVHVAKRVGSSMYVRTLKFVLLYRCCFNMLYPFLDDDSQEEQMEDLTIRKKKKKKLGLSTTEYSSTVSSKLIPEICNEFILNFCQTLSKREWMPQHNDLLALTQHLCSWLLKEDYTNREIVPNKSLT